MLVINELASTITSYRFHERSGQLEPIETQSTLPEGWQGTSHCADIHVAPSGRFVYGSNRGHDSLAILAVDPDSGHLTWVGHVSTHGRTPRNFAISDDGSLVLAANQATDNIVPYSVNQETGELTRTRHDTQCLTPVCLKIVQL
jgi:6-phosphogluconolactonase